ncbi:Beta-glucan synthesis-associated protein KRE6 AltName: Full=Killer toxin-resistance protein 6 [Serendipita indica DSM 11827]|nr:Beta-glucan synthesis-associated protein KRE6 AltName: Full=Killer toxin-resistance protein 6 [Serendipita indica DSM 11827]
MFRLYDSKRSKSQDYKGGDYIPLNPRKRQPVPTPNSSIANQFALSPDPNQWGYNVSPNDAEADDWIHVPDKKIDDTGSILNPRGISALGCIGIIFMSILTLFFIWPLETGIRKMLTATTQSGFNVGGINSTEQVYETAFALVDKDTPQDVRRKTSPVDNREMVLVFSDEFELEGRTFWPGDDPYWEAVDMHYWGTDDLEWYDPQQAYTKDGQLWIEFQEAKREDNHNLTYVSAMITTWNKFCFTGGLIETSVQLPGSSKVKGFWLWTMGNLGRAGFGATTEGLWPYSYESCDIGTVKNQTESSLSQPFPPHCEPHPGPVYADGTYAGRGAPEIDVLEALIDPNLLAGAVSQSAQFAPYSAEYKWDNLTYGHYYGTLGDDQYVNTYPGGVWQQTASTVSKTNQGCYELEEKCFATYGFQYVPGYQENGAYITWINDGKLAWRMDAQGFGEDATTQIGKRAVSKEPMYVIINLGLSDGFSHGIPFDELQFPAYMKVDWIRVYQYEDAMNVSCDPPNFPTSNYINAYVPLLYP